MPASIRRGCIGLVDGRQHLGPKRSSGCRRSHERLPNLPSSSRDESPLARVSVCDQRYDHATDIVMPSERGSLLYA